MAQTGAEAGQVSNCQCGGSELMTSTDGMTALVGVPCPTAACTEADCAAVGAVCKYCGVPSDENPQIDVHHCPGEPVRCPDSIASTGAMADDGCDAMDTVTDSQGVSHDIFSYHSDNVNGSGFRVCQDCSFAGITDSGAATSCVSLLDGNECFRQRFSSINWPACGIIQEVECPVP